MAACSAHAMTSEEEFNAVRSENPRGALAALCFAIASTLASAAYEGKDADHVVPLVFRRSIAQGARAYGDIQIFFQKGSSAMSLYSDKEKLLQQPNSTDALNTLATLRTQVALCGKNLEHE